MHSSKIRNGYVLADAFQALGKRLYGPQWTGQEIWGRKSEDPTAVLEARVPFEMQLDEINDLMITKQRERKAAIKKDEIHRINMDLQAMKNEQGEIFYKLHEIGEVRNFEVDDHQRWERFSQTEGILLQAFRNEDLGVFGLSSLFVNSRLWTDWPNDFGCDWELSLVFWPASESAKRVDAARIDEDQFDKWLDTVIPINSSEVENLTPEQLAFIWFRGEVANYDGRTKRSHFQEMALAEFPGLSINGFGRIWADLATPAMKRPGPRSL
jgi:hypothetical protein